MPNTTSKIAIAVFLSLIINAPFAIGELLTNDASGVRTNFPLALFVGLWVEIAVSAYLLISIVDSFKNGTANKKKLLLAVQIFALGILMWAWSMLIIDQWPCFFLGGSGC